MKRCFLSSISAVLIRGFQGVHPKNLLALQYVRNLDVTKMRNGEWGMGNGKWGMGNGMIPGNGK